MPVFSAEEHIASIYETLFGTWGRQHWWPARTRFEVIVGSYLTQNTNWTNVELALRQLRAAGVLNVGGIRKISRRNLEHLIRSSGYFRQKTQRLKTFVEFLDQNYGGSLTRMFARPTPELREQLLALNGIGPETADSILLYAGQHPVFVVDAYTRRIVARHGILREDAKYEDVRTTFERALAAPASSASTRPSAVSLGGASHRPSRMSLAAREPLAQVFNEMHGLIVGVGKKYCLKSGPHCEECPLKPLLPEGK
jgi:endonuclease III related protein